MLYVADQVSATNGIINKFSLVGGNWTPSGGFTNTTGIDGLFATPSGNGGVDVFYTTGSGGTPTNSLIRVTDAAGWNQNISITSSNVLYTATGSASLKGIAFVPQATPNTAQLIPPPVLTAQKGANVGSTFTVTNTPADPAWHGAITGITVNGSPLPAAAYDTTQPNRIVFNPAESVLLQGSGPKTIVVTATQLQRGGGRPDHCRRYPADCQWCRVEWRRLELYFHQHVGFELLSAGHHQRCRAAGDLAGDRHRDGKPGGSGQFQFTDPNPATNSALFYKLRQP